MFCFDNNRYSKWIQRFFNSIFNLYCQSFLNLQAACKNIDDPGYFAEPCYPAIRNIGYMGFANKWQHMMLTHAIDLNVFYHDHFTYFFMELGRINNGLCI